MMEERLEIFLERHRRFIIETRAAFRGYAALPPPNAQNRIKQAAWWETLGVAKNAEWGAVVKAYKEKAKEHHPDNPNGSSAKMAEINGAYEEAKKVKGL